MMGEIALYSFIILLLTGTYLSFFFDPSMTEVQYDGSYSLLRGVEMSRAYDSTLDISFDVRGGLLMRQIHHWAALLFLAAMIVHMLRVFFTGGFRKPREINWLLGVGLLTLGILEGFAGYSLPDDLLSGTGLRIAHAIMLSIPVVGTWVAFAVFGVGVPRHRDHPAALHRARAAGPGHHPRADRGARGPGREAEAHPVPRSRPDRAQRRRRADVPAVRG